MKIQRGYAPVNGLQIYYEIHRVANTARAAARRRRHHRD
jgi:hypothetical protein